MSGSAGEELKEKAMALTVGQKVIINTHIHHLPYLSTHSLVHSLACFFVRMYLLVCRFLGTPTHTSPPVLTTGSILSSEDGRISTTEQIIHQRNNIHTLRKPGKLFRGDVKIRVWGGRMAKF